METPQIATHPLPCWREKADFILQADLADHGLPGTHEQLWGRRVGDDTFEICCIPFFTYGISLGDIVKAGRRGDRPWVVSEVIERRGHGTVRLAFANPQQADALHEQIHASLAKWPWPHEWRGSGYVALDVPVGESPDAIIDLFRDEIDSTILICEIAS